MMRYPELIRKIPDKLSIYGDKNGLHQTGSGSEDGVEPPMGGTARIGGIHQ